MSEAALLSARGLGVTLQGREVLSNIDIEVFPGKIVTLIGPNGAGKSTLVKVLLGLQGYDTGSIVRSPHMRVGYMPQKLQVPDNLPLTVKRFLCLGPHATCAQLELVAEEVGVTHLMDSSMQTLSGGEHQRVLLARALMRRPDLLVLDEPVQGVDVTGQSELYALIAQLRDRLGCGVLMVSHDLHLVMASTDSVVCLNSHVCCSGHPDSVSQHPAYLELFGNTVGSGLAVYTHHHDHTHDAHGNVVAGDQHKDHPHG